MGKPGPKPKPPSLRIIEGNPAKRPIPETPKAQVIYPEPPKWIRGVARKEWKRIVPELAKVGLLTSLDMTMLEAYCRAYALWRESIGMRGEAARFKDMKTLAIEFGMTPAARMRVEFIKQHESKDEDLD